MALPRLLTALSSYHAATDKLPPKDQSDELFFKSSEHSRGIPKIYTQNNALTLFLGTKPNDINTLYFFLDQIQSACFAYQPLRFGHHHDLDHADMHQTASDYEENHAHLVKGNFERITSVEFKCLVRLIKDIESKTDRCLDGKNDCLLSTNDADALIKKVEKYHARVAHAAATKEQSPALCPEEIKGFAELDQAVKTRILSGTHSFICTFVSTLLECYVKPYLISSNKMTPAKAVFATGLATESMAYLLTGSATRVAFSKLTGYALQVILTQTGIDAATIDKTTRQISMVTAFLQNPLSITDLIYTQSAVALGQKMAFEVIHNLPKLRQEPEAQEANVTESSQTTAYHPGLRQRK